MRSYVSGSCADIVAHRAALWTFVDREGVEPISNHAEGELRAFVLWRKRSFGTQRQRGTDQGDSMGSGKEAGDSIRFRQSERTSAPHLSWRTPPCGHRSRISSRALRD
ncbi:MAG: transposase [Myxococcaceae bacterium]|nr:transposase [Myxococcaceae bacterium]MCA3016245.1 transposase [Myxococcaceae bacterium]